MATKQALLDAGISPWPPSDPNDQAVKDFAKAVASVVFNGEANLGTFLRGLMVPQRLPNLAVSDQGAFDEVTLSAPGAVLAVNAVSGSPTGPLVADAVGTPGSGEYGVIYDGDGVATIRLDNGSDAITQITVMALQLPAEMAAVLNEEV